MKTSLKLAIHLNCIINENKKFHAFLKIKNLPNAQEIVIMIDKGFTDFFSLAFQRC